MAGTYRGGDLQECVEKCVALEWCNAVTVNTNTAVCEFVAQSTSDIAPGPRTIASAEAAGYELCLHPAAAAQPWALAKAAGAAPPLWSAGSAGSAAARLEVRGCEVRVLTERGAPVWGTNTRGTCADVGGWRLALKQWVEHPSGSGPWWPFDSKGEGAADPEWFEAASGGEDDDDAHVFQRSIFDLDAGYEPLSEASSRHRYVSLGGLDEYRLQQPAAAAVGASSPATRAEEQQRGSLLFKLVWPELPDGENSLVWTQQSDPTASSAPVVGYVPLSVPFAGGVRDGRGRYAFAGLRRTPPDGNGGALSNRFMFVGPFTLVDRGTADSGSFALLESALSAATDACGGDEACTGFAIESSRSSGTLSFSFATVLDGTAPDDWVTTIPSAANRSDTELQFQVYARTAYATPAFVLHGSTEEALDENELYYGVGQVRNAKSHLPSDGGWRSLGSGRCVEAGYESGGRVLTEAQRFTGISQLQSCLQRCAETEACVGLVEYSADRHVCRVLVSECESVAAGQGSANVPTSLRTEAAGPYAPLFDFEVWATTQRAGPGGPFAARSLEPRRVELYVLLFAMQNTP